MSHLIPLFPSFVECGSPLPDIGYVIDSYTETTLGATASLRCDTNYIGSPADITCQMAGWSQQSGCEYSKLSI